MKTEQTECSCAMEQKIKEEFSTRFGGEGILFASAGRINLIG